MDEYSIYKTECVPDRDRHNNNYNIFVFTQIRATGASEEQQ